MYENNFYTFASLFMSIAVFAAAKPTKHTHR